MALTFDDGPGDTTSQLLDILDRYRVQATFFVSGNNNGRGPMDNPATGWPDVMRRMHAAGHQIGSHTWTHRDLDQLEREGALDLRQSEITNNEMAFLNIFGWFPTYLRPPYLECSGGCQEFLREWGYHIISTNVDTKDYENDDPALIENSKRKFSDAVSRGPSGNGYIVLAHDVHYQTVVTLAPYMIEESRNRGYRLVTVGECLGDPRQNWYRTSQLRRRSSEAPQSSSPQAQAKPLPAASPVYAKPTRELTSSPNQRCGARFGYTCHGSTFGT
ncbi:hypothetical protein HIM_04234 [Hirsutella minnesotensis 3608]|uniref:NodB homology domain-containing protein n=1 Tax=Hirsutella minnesotensis 3608 TaxID=1043627 RepID=A0A0F7ZQ24_9HYPO|nr:hypothetical protein HIM_04234 [Hirsutella minnesotensis 3608]